MENPYLPSPSGMTPAPAEDPGPLREPRVVSVLGWADLIFGTAGIIAAIVTVTGFIMLQFHPQVDLVPGTISTTVKIAPEWQELVTVVLSTLIAVSALSAGYRLVKQRHNALRTANLFAFISIGMKLLNLLVMPSLGFDPTSLKLPWTGGSSLVITFSGQIAGITIYLIYPLLCLILLNRPGVRKWLARNGR